MIVCNFNGELPCRLRIHLSFCTPIDEIRTQIRGYEVRRLNYGEFAVFFRIDDDRCVVQILTIRHGKRQPWLEEEDT